MFFSLQVYLLIYYAILLYYNVANGTVILSDRDNHLLCGDDQIRLSCHGNGSHLRWYNSGVLTFTQYDLVDHDGGLIDRNLVAVIWSKHYIFANVWQFTSKLYSLEPVSSISLLNFNISCDTDSSHSNVSIIIAGTYVQHNY